MIKKKALIFGYPGEKGDDGYCTGVSFDIRNYSSYLTSLGGGVWKADKEVFVEEQPINKKRLKKYIDYFNSEAEYSVFICWTRKIS